MTPSTKINNLPAALREFSSQFALISGAAALLAVFCATVFLFAYVRVFDWRLIWLVEYSDVLKVGIVAIAFFSGLAIYVWLVLSDAFEVAKPSSRGWIKYSVRAIWIGSMLYWLYREHETGEARYALVAFVFLSILMIFLSAWLAVRTTARRDARGLMFLAFVFVLTVGILGTAFGYYSRDAWRTTEYEAFLDGGETLAGARLVMLTSRHAVFYVSGATVTVPTAAVKRINSRRR